MNKVMVLMSTYNGQKYLSEQVDSLVKQKGVVVDILVRDDASSDKTQDMLRDLQEKEVLKWYTGENKRSANSFMDLLNKASGANYYAFCDQDDVWDNDKLEVAITSLSKFPKDKPALYFSNTRLVDENLMPIDGKQPQSTETFSAALVVCHVTGCTMVFNNALMEELKKYKPNNIIMHDWWVYLVCLALGGNVFWDHNAHLCYRQHGNNVIGGKNTLKQKIARRLSTLTSRERLRSVQNKELLIGYGKSMSTENKRLAEIAAFYNESVKNKFTLLFERTIRTPYPNINFSYIMAVILGIY